MNSKLSNASTGYSEYFIHGLEIHSWKTTEISRTTSVVMISYNPKAINQQNYSLIIHKNR